MVVEHQQHARKGQHDEQVKGNPAHSPGVAVADRIAIDLGGVQVQEDVGKHAQCAVARRVIVFVAEDRGVDLGLGGIFQAFHLFFGLRRDVGLKGLDVALHPIDDCQRDLPFFSFCLSSGIRSSYFWQPAVHPCDESKIPSYSRRCYARIRRRWRRRSLNWLGCPLGHW